MGCKTSLFSETNQLIVTQGVPQNLQSPSSQKSTFTSLGTLYNNDQHTVDKLKKTAKWLLRSRGNYSELLDILELWVLQVYQTVEDALLSKADIKTSATLDSSGALTITHFIDGIRQFECIQNFCQALSGTVSITKVPFFDSEKFNSCQEFLLNLCPLTTILYLKLGSQVDCGIGVQKPMDKRQLSMFLARCGQKQTISRWIYLNNHPIPTSFTFACLGESRKVSFYIFDGLRAQNYQKGFSLFETFGQKIPQKVKEALQSCRGDEVRCALEVDNSQVLVTSLQVSDADLLEQLIPVLDTPCSTHMLNKFQRCLKPQMLSLDLKVSGISLSLMSLYDQLIRMMQNVMNRRK